jgi:hypothetical protein
MKQSSTQRVLTNGIAKFPIWIDATIDSQSDVVTAAVSQSQLSKRRIVINDGIADLSGMPALNSDSDDSESDIDLLNSDDGVSSPDFCCMTAQKYVLRGGQLQHADAPTPPPLTKQVSDEAAHGSSTSSGTSGDDGSLSDDRDFIDKNDLSLTHLQATTLMRFFPIMCQNIIENGI